VRARSHFGYDAPWALEDLVQARLGGRPSQRRDGRDPRARRRSRATCENAASGTDAADVLRLGRVALAGSARSGAPPSAWAYRLAFHSATSTGAHKRERRLATSEASVSPRRVRTTALTHERRRGALDELRAELAADEQTLLFLRVDQQLPWDDVAASALTSHPRRSTAAVRKRFERLKEAAGLARDAASSNSQVPSSGDVTYPDERGHYQRDRPFCTSRAAPDRSRSTSFRRRGLRRGHTNPRLRGRPRLRRGVAGSDRGRSGERARACG
jgi:hypothetical protein